MTVDAATRTLLAGFGDAKPLEQMTVEEARAIHVLMHAHRPPGPAMASSTDHVIDAAGGGTFSVRVVVPHGDVAGVVVYLHGGGWVLGGLDPCDSLIRELAARSGCAVVAVDYRLAPEHRYPAAVDDCWTAVRWADARIEELAGRRVPLIVAGDSSGGNLAAVVAQRARAAGPALALQVLVYPVVDANFDTASYLDPENELMLTRAGMRWFWDHYAPEPADREEPSASPLAATDLSGLAPALLVLAEHDVLRSGAEAYAAALEAAGVAVQRRVFDGQMHMFFVLIGLLPASLDAIAFVAGRIRDAATQAPAAALSPSARDA